MTFTKLSFRFLMLVYIFFVIVPKVNAQPNTFPIPGRVGIGPQSTFGGGPVPQPMDLLHIHGVNPTPNSLYNEPTLRISLDDAGPPYIIGRANCIPPLNFTTCPSQIYGLLSMQNDYTVVFPPNPPNPPPPPIVRYSSFAQKYDFVLSTANPIDATFTSLQTCPFKFDLIVSTKNPLSSIRFGTTPLNSPISIVPNDIERMTILNNGFIGIGNVNNNYCTNSQTLPIKSQLQVGNISIIPTDFRQDRGTWGSIGYNNWWDPNAGAHGQPKRLENGPVSGIGFEPWHKENNLSLWNESNHGLNSDGSLILWACPNGLADQTYSTGSSLNLRPFCGTLGQGPGELFFEMWNENGAYPILFDYQCPTWNAAGTDVNNDGHFFIKDQVVIGRMNKLSSTVHPPFFPDKPYMLVVDGSALAKELIIDARQTVTWPDFVFNADYKLQDLSELENQIRTQHHLPGIPSAKDVEETGIVVGDIESKLLQKIEELTLYVIQLEKKNDQLNQRLEKVESKNNINSK